MESTSSNTRQPTEGSTGERVRDQPTDQDTRSAGSRASPEPESGLLLLLLLALLLLFLLLGVEDLFGRVLRREEAFTAAEAAAEVLRALLAPRLEGLRALVVAPHGRLGGPRRRSVGQVRNVELRPIPRIGLSVERAVHGSQEWVAELPHWPGGKRSGRVVPSGYEASRRRQSVVRVLTCRLVRSGRKLVGSLRRRRERSGLRHRRLLQHSLTE